MNIGLGSLVRQSINRWIDHEGPRLGAALAFYSLLSISPALILIVAVLSMLFSKQVVQQEVVFDVALFVDHRAAAAIQGLMGIAPSASHGVLATIVGGVVLVIGASAVFSELKDALNRMWDDTPRPFGFRRLLRDRLVAIVLVVAVGLFVAISVAMAAVLGSLHHMFGGMSPMPAFVIGVFNFLLSLVTSALVFLLIFRYVPDVALPWKILAIGAAVSAVLFSIGKALLGLYLHWSGVGTAYGAAGSLVAVLVWIYYSAQIFYLGAEFTCACGRAFVAPKQVNKLSLDRVTSQ
jgi:membrane protein